MLGEAGVRQVIQVVASWVRSMENQMGPQIHIIKQQLPDDLQVLFFSATFPDDVRKFGTGLIPTSRGIKARRGDATAAVTPSSSGQLPGCYQLHWQIRIDDENNKKNQQVYMNCADEEEKFNQLCNVLPARAGSGRFLW
eukprot:Skav222764  [mRNA]  locus=scaffold600:261719:263626:- [translate_table: standard]